MCCKINYLEGSKSTLLMYIKTVQHLWDTIFLYMSIGSVVFSSYVLRKRNEMPKIKGKKYINHVDFTPLKTQLAKSFLCVAVSPAVPPRRLLCPSPAAAAGPPAHPGAVPAPEPPLPNLDTVLLFLIIGLFSFFFCVIFFVAFFLFCFVFCFFF